ncbi:MAG: hypothetical protein A2452_01610 [Candidatus Firestonebacteria bacterium RIFOXYC2_FULL_39_67]|nr:MAG: hypothetical protein A2536_00705 [Candidatus Firestonebacteria bacterium RIFOXYD2_FULL_39_29]OGF52353.1 MAG: hypothetical protein A2497_05860 [Candidatus Firestonebacteria bacterium RifOxyC12_full_39_7]OGF53646.1 MAG: hypothetical protein A2452_01610 [Candidatus Firestonebacteria bacterium RIFOXYC2_FULL_39_67]
MEEVKKVFLPMKLGELLDETFKIYRKHFLVFVQIFAVLNLPIIIVNTATGFFEGPYGKIASSFISIILTLLVMPVINFLLARTISDGYLGKKVTLLTTFKHFDHMKFRKMIGTLIHSGLMIFLGFLCLIIPGFIFLFRYALVPQIIAIEGTYGKPALERSQILMKKNFGNLMTAGFVVGIISYAIYGVILLPMIIYAALHHSAGATPLAPTGILMVSMTFTIQVLSAIVVTPLMLTAYTLFYYNMRIKKEGFDIQMLASSVSDEQGSVPVK